MNSIDKNHHEVNISICGYILLNRPIVCHVIPLLFTGKDYSLFIIILWLVLHINYVGLDNKHHFHFKISSLVDLLSAYSFQ